eukprot:gene1879-1020_t
MSTTEVVVCEHCEEHPATCCCEICKTKFCEECFSIIHKSKRMVLHQKYDVNHELLPNCPKHVEKDCELFCFQDKNMICSICAVTDHLNHQVMPIKDAATQFKQELKNYDYDTISGVILENIQKSIEEIKQNEKRLEDLKKKYETEKTKLEQEIVFSKKKEESNRVTLKSIKEIQETVKQEKNMQKILQWNVLVSNYTQFLQNIYGWGENTEGQLGIEETDKLDPQKLSLTSAQQLTCGFRHTLVLSNGFVYTFGGNNNGQLGIGNCDNTSKPQKLSFSNVVAIASGGNHSFAILKDGTAYGWGLNDNGELGIGSKDKQTTPQKLPLENVKAIYCGFNFTFAILNDGSIYAFGGNSEGQLGIGNHIDQKSPCKVKLDDKIILIACGNRHAVALSHDNQVYAWGCNTEGQLGLEQTKKLIKSTSHKTMDSVDHHQLNVPNKLSLPLSGIKSIVCGYYHTIALLKDGTAFSWGSNNAGQLGIGHSDHEKQAKPTKLSISNVSQVVCGHRHTLALKTDGSVFGWGYNTRAELGIGNKQNQSAPQKIALKNVKFIACGARHSFAISN